MNIVQFWWNWRYDGGRYVAHIFRLLLHEGLLIPQWWFNQLFMFYWFSHILRLLTSIQFSSVRPYEPSTVFLKYMDPEETFKKNFFTIFILILSFGLGINCLIASVKHNFVGWRWFYEQSFLVREYYENSLLSKTENSLKIKQKIHKNLLNFNPFLRIMLMLPVIRNFYSLFCLGI